MKRRYLSNAETLSADGRTDAEARDLFQQRHLLRRVRTVGRGNSTLVEFAVFLFPPSYYRSSLASTSSNFRYPLHVHMSERDPLLRHDPSLSGQRQGEGEGGQKGVSRPPGPLEISRSTRYGILAGLWMATFLSVSLYICSIPSH